MKLLLDLIAQGGIAMIAIMVLSVVLYGRCFQLMLDLWSSRRSLQTAPAATREQAQLYRQRQVVLQQNFRHQRAALGAMIAAAPLLGLLGTVTGMERTFSTLASSGTKSLEGLAGGVSQVLVATESGLAVALPAMLLVYLAHRQTQRQVEILGRLAAGPRGVAA
jgi:biopolymer transport protein ExbB